MAKDKLRYWISIVDKMSGCKNLAQMVPEVLEDLCRTFDFGSGFVYVAGDEGHYFLEECFSSYGHTHLPPRFDLEGQLGTALAGALAGEAAVVFRGDMPAETELEKELGRLFGAGSMVLVPVVGQADELMGLVGLVDRRGMGRHAQEDMDFARSVLSTLANYIKMGMYQQMAQNAEQNLELTLDNMGIDVYVNDFHTHEILYLNHSMAAPYGGIEDMLGKVCWQALYDGKTEECDFCPQKKLIDKDGNPTKVYSWDYQRPFDGAWFRVFSAAVRWVDGRLAHIVSSVDITENKRNEEIVRQIAEVDYLTSLPNRYSLTSAIDRYTTGREAATEGYMLFFDLDGFKAVNDTMGHDAGDELLKQIGAALQANPLTKNNSYRYGGDEFVVLLRGGCTQVLRKVVDSLRRMFEQPWLLKEGQARVSASIGISHYPEDDTKTGDLVRKVDQAMYIAKHSGKGQVRFFNQGMYLSAEDWFARRTPAQAAE